MIGVSISPSSFTCVDPASFPNALPINTAPGTFSRNRFPLCGSTAVTPVRTLSPRINVAWPTATPATSVMELSAPVGSTPTTMPTSRARGLLVSCPCTITNCSIKLQRIAKLERERLFIVKRVQSVARIASNAGMVNHSSPFTKKITNPQKPRRFIHLLICISRVSSTAQEDLAAAHRSFGRLQQRS